MNTTDETRETAAGARATGVAMRLLVTGGTGVLGRALAPLARAAGHELLAPTRKELDLFDPVAVADATRGVDAVLHLATRIRPPSSSATLRLGTITIGFAQMPREFWWTQRSPPPLPLTCNQPSRSSSRGGSRLRGHPDHRCFRDPAIRTHRRA